MPWQTDQERHEIRERAATEWARKAPTADLIRRMLSQRYATELPSMHYERQAAADELNRRLPPLPEST